MKFNGFFFNRLSSVGPDTAHVINGNKGTKGKNKKACISSSPMNLINVLSIPLLLDEKMC